MNTPTPIELTALLTDQVLRVTGLTQAVRDQISALEFMEKRERRFANDSRGLNTHLMAVKRAAKLGTVQVYNSAAQRRYIHIFDAGHAPQDGEYPRLILPIDADQTVSEDLSPLGFGLGIYICLSSTNTTKTIVTSNEATFFCSYQFD